MVFYVVVILGGLLLVRSLNISSHERFDDSFGASLVFSVAMAVVANVVFEIGGLLGFGTLKNLLTGRYVQPKREQRAFLLIDMKDSTGHGRAAGASAVSTSC